MLIRPTCRYVWRARRAPYVKCRRWWDLGYVGRGELLVWSVMLEVDGALVCHSLLSMFFFFEELIAIDVVVQKGCRAAWFLKGAVRCGTGLPFIDAAYPLLLAGERGSFVSWVCAPCRSSSNLRFDG